MDSQTPDSKMYKLEYNGTYCIYASKKELLYTLDQGDLDMLYPDTEGEALKISAVFMTREEYESLPEFEGF